MGYERVTAEQDGPEKNRKADHNASVNAEGLGAGREVLLEPENDVQGQQEVDRVLEGEEQTRGTPRRNGDGGRRVHVRAA